MANVMGASMMDDIDEALDEACGNVGLKCGRRELRGVWSQKGSSR